MPGRSSVDHAAIDNDPVKLAYLTWLTTPKAQRDPPSERGFARKYNISVKTLYNWRQNSEFKRRWELETDGIIGGDDRRQAIFDALFETATDREHKQHVQAATAYVKLIDEIKPTAGNIRADKPLSQMSMQELQLMAAQAAQEELAAQ